jgi:hypothetical protein
MKPELLNMCYSSGTKHLDFGPKLEASQYDTPVMDC